MSFFTELNNQYLKRHIEREDAFWSAKMALKDAVDGEFETKELELKELISDASFLEKIRLELERDDLTEDERIGFQGWKRFFEANAIENEEAKEVQKKIIAMEGELARARRDMKLGYIDPETKEFVSASSVQLRLIVQTDENEAKRKAAWEGLRSIENFVLDNGLVDIIKERNRLGRLQGYTDFYEWRVQVNEGFSKEKLFHLLDHLAANTKEVCKAAVEKVISENGEDAAQPWNFDYATSGDLTAEKDPYMRFEDALLRWGRSFAAMGIRYRGATLTIDLMERKGKYENGFMHGPFPAFIDNGKFRPAKINFTANAVPGQMGSGQRAIETFFHEGGHAAHFSNIRMPSPCFSQEFAPTSIAFAETQSMFLDSIVNDADWLTLYSKNKDGNPIPFDLIKKILEDKQKFRSNLLRKLMIVPYFERAIYEMDEAELNAESILEVGRDIEQTMSFMPSDSRPILSVPHLLESDSSAYYHAYVLAMMAVYQTRAFFLERDGFITDNPKIGPDLAEIYWKPGNSKNFLQLVEELTGEPFSADATIELVNQPLEEVFEDAEKSVQRVNKSQPYQDKVNLDAIITMAHGDVKIASTENSSFEDVAEIYGNWLIKKENS
ncbi:MAG: M3 family metallopeptidase [Candidatus Electryonea clarkiae]|nr:M3 family metallopeptidase [Candidatus Electryonea clarkiae]MDP8287710.1 M3 family metallopeptidase [Candidatus Electryonea clarkiae]